MFLCLPLPVENQHREKAALKSLVIVTCLEGQNVYPECI